MKKKKNLTGNGWKSLISWLRNLNMRSLLQWTGGSPSLKYLNIAVFFTISVIGSLEKLKSSGDPQVAITFCVPFVILILINIFIKIQFIDKLSNIILTVLTILLVPYGNLTGLLFFIFIIYTIDNKVDYFTYGSILLISIIFEGVEQNVSVPQIAMILIGYSFLMGKYIYTIHIPTQKLKTENKALKTKLSIVGDAKHLTDDQILHYYPVMAHHDYDRKYSKINMIRNFSDGMTRTKLAVKYDCSAKTIDRYLSEMKDDFGKLLNIKIAENTHLIKVCAMLDIIQVIVRQKEY